MLSFSAAVMAAKNLPPDVEAFLDRYYNCEHFSGEPGYDAERREYLKKMIEQYCWEWEPDLKRLQQKYQANPAVLKELKDIYYN